MIAATGFGVDLGATVASIANDARDRIGAVISSTLETLRDQDMALGEQQTSVLLSNLLSSFDGFERETARTLVDDFGHAGVAMCGLPRELADLLPAADAARRGR